MSAKATKQKADKTSSPKPKEDSSPVSEAPKPKASEDLTITETFSVPKISHRRIIGRNGDKQKTIENKHSVSIKLPTVDDPSDVVTLRGRSAEAIAAARREIEEIANRPQPGFSTTVEIPADRRAAVIGRSGENLTRLREAGAVEIKVPRTGEAGGVFLAANTQADLDSAVVLLKQLLQTDSPTEFKRSFADKKKKDKREVHSKRVVFPLPQAQHGILIGQGGMTLRELRAISDGADFELPKADEKVDQIIITGSTDAQIEAAKVAINDLILASRSAIKRTDSPKPAAASPAADKPKKAVATTADPAPAADKAPAPTAKGPKQQTKGPKPKADGTAEPAPAAAAPVKAAEEPVKAAASDAAPKQKPQQQPKKNAPKAK